MAVEHVLEDLLRRAAPFALRELERELDAAEKAVARTSDARVNLGLEASDARVATVNKNCKRACEHRDRLSNLRAELKEAQRRG